MTVRCRRRVNSTTVVSCPEGFHTDARSSRPITMRMSRFDTPRTRVDGMVALALVMLFFHSGLALSASQRQEVPVLSAQEDAALRTPSLHRTAERLQRRLARNYSLAVSLPRVEDAMLFQRAMFRRSVTVTFVSTDGQALPAWTASLHRYPSWMQARLEEEFRFEIDQDAVADTLRLFPPEGIVAPVDAVLTSVVDDRGVMRAVVEGIAKPGYRLDEADAADVLARAFIADIRSVTLGAHFTPGEIVNQSGVDIGSLTLLASGRSDFYGSGLGRRANVRRGLEQYLHNTVVYPGESFSFNHTTRDMEDSGWEMALGIFNGEELRPIPGGGICQVATTLYRSILQAGLPVVSRAPHSLFVTYYAKHGVGIDATVYPGEQDLVFRNDTPNLILIQAYADGTDAYVRLYGTPDGRTATLSGPYFASNAPLDLQVNGRSLRRNEIAWYQDLRYPDGRTERKTILSRYKELPRSLAGAYAMR
jgi:vancomycin resistance protein YoaR